MICLKVVKISFVGVIILLIVAGFSLSILIYDVISNPEKNKYEAKITLEIDSFNSSAEVYFPNILTINDSNFSPLELLVNTYDFLNFVLVNGTCWIYACVNGKIDISASVSGYDEIYDVIVIKNFSAVNYYEGSFFYKKWIVPICVIANRSIFFKLTWFVLMERTCPGRLFGERVYTGGGWGGESLNETLKNGLNNVTVRYMHQMVIDGSCYPYHGLMLFLVVTIIVSVIMLIKEKKSITK